MQLVYQYTATYLPVYSYLPVYQYSVSYLSTSIQLATSLPVYYSSYLSISIPVFCYVYTPTVVCIIAETE